MHMLGDMLGMARLMSPWSVDAMVALVSTSRSPVGILPPS